jgi:hypothetical protein
MPDADGNQQEAGYKKTLVNVIGTGRSGSTMLELMLANSKDACACGEIEAVFRPWRKGHFSPSCNCGDPDCDLWYQARDISRHTFHSWLAERMSATYVVDSSKSLNWVVGNNRLDEFQTFNLLIHKEPVNLSFSHFKRGNSSSRWEIPYRRYHTRLMQLNLPFVSVRYEQLVLEPRMVLESICDFIGMPYYSGKERFWEKTHHYVFGSGGTAGQTGRENGRLSLPVLGEDFRPFVAGIEEQLVTDRELAGIRAFLLGRDLPSLPSEARQLIREQSLGGFSRKVYPPWYYVESAKRVLRRLIPQR